jgi:fumarate reductase flavoprotein subunit
MTPSVLHSTALPAGTPHVPVAIVGAGACGLVTALSLRNAGVDCVVLERDAQPSGSTALSSGLIPACGTHMQRALGISDSVALFSQDITSKSHGTAAPHLVQAYTSAVGPAIDMLADRHGLNFHVQEGFLFPSHSVLRMHSVAEKTGAALVGYLERAAQAAGADIVTEATVRTLWVDDTTQRVAGVSFERPDGALEHLRCDALVLACNGFGGNTAMVCELLPAMRDAPFAGHTGNDGSAIAWGRALGARLADLGGYQGHGSWATPHGALVTWAVMMEGAIQLNARGERFHDETGGYSEAAVKVLAQPGAVAWDILDDTLLALARTFPDFCDAEAAGAVKTCADVAGVAALIGADPATVATSCATAPKRPLVAPFHVVKVTGALFHTQGGLDIDAHCRVLHDDGTPFPNLLAAGGAARGVSGNEVWGYMSGNGLLSAVGGGAIAAATVVEMLPS